MRGAPPTDERHAEAGFTLVELLVGLALFSLLSLLVLSALRLGTAAWERGGAHASRLQEMLQAQGLLRHLVGEAYPRFVAVPAGKGYVDFDGHAGSLAILADGPMSLGTGGRFRFTLRVEGEAGARRLMLDAMAELIAEGDATAPPSRTVIAGLASLEFAYFGIKGGRGPAAWHADWEHEPAPPTLVRIRAAYPKGDAGIWPDLVIRPRVEADVSCVHDPLTKACRGR